MTVYRRRAASSPFALDRSLGRRREGLERVARQRAYDPSLEAEDGVDPRDLDDLGEGAPLGRISAAFPTSSAGPTPGDISWGA